MNYVTEFLNLFPYGFGVGFIIYVCLSLLGFGIYKALSIVNSKA